MVKAIMIVEMMGRPPEHIRKAIEDYTGQMNKFKGIEIIKREFSEPKEVELKEGEKVDDKNKLYTCFCEVEFVCRDFRQLIDIVFDFMPASVEILDPAKLTFSLDEATSMINNLSGRLHRYDEVAKVMKNREEFVYKQNNLMKKLLFNNKIIDKDGKILKRGLDEVNKPKKAKKEKKPEKSNSKKIKFSTSV